MFTPYPELDTILADLLDSVRDILGDTFVGMYLQGSFALGAGDLDSDCDFIVATSTPPTGAIEARLRVLHDEIPTRPGHWSTNIEGSYADVGSLRGVDGLAIEHLDPRWRPLLTQVISDRAIGWDPADPPRPGSMATTYEFATYAESFA